MIARPTDTEFRYRVLADPVDIGDAVFAEAREFRTLKGAQAHAVRYRTSMIQTGYLVWMTADEEAAVIAMLAEGRAIPRLGETA